MNKKILLCAFLLTLALVMQAQESLGEKVFDAVERMPSFPGGSEALVHYLSNNIKYPVDEEKEGTQGNVIVTFIVEKDGSIVMLELKNH